MSVGVLIINNGGIALASDSALSLREANMVYNTYERITAVSDRHLVAAAHFGKNDFYGVSMKQILGEFGRYIDEEQLTEFSRIPEMFVGFLTDRADYYGYKEDFKKDASDFLQKTPDKHLIENEDYAKFVFAGYGDSEAFPSYCVINVYGFFDGRLNYEICDSSNNAANEPLIKSFGQTDAVDTFLYGIDSYYVGFAENMHESFYENLLADPDLKISPKVQEKMMSDFREESRKLDDRVADSLKENNLKPLIKSIRILPLNEMAKLADSLVDIAALHTKYVLDGNQQTVGGKTNILLISKAKGYEWVKDHNEVI